MPRYSFERGALSVLQWLHIVERDLLEHELTIANADGIVSGVCDGIRLDDVHGFKVRVADCWYPVSAIKTHGAKIK